MLGLCFCARAFSSCGERGPLFIVVRGPLTIVASLVAEHRLQMCRLSSCGSRTQLLRGMWDLPRPGLEPVSPALAGRFSTIAPPGKPWTHFKLCSFFFLEWSFFSCLLSGKLLWNYLYSFTPFLGVTIPGQPFRTFLTLRINSFLFCTLYIVCWSWVLYFICTASFSPGLWLFEARNEVSHVGLQSADSVSVWPIGDL